LNYYIKLIYIFNKINYNYGIHTLDVTGPKILERAFTSFFNREDRSRLEIGRHRLYKKHFYTVLILQLEEPNFQSEQRVITYNNTIINLIITTINTA
jgi:hypothetical protein